MRAVVVATLCLAAGALSGCSTFGLVRSGRVTPGLHHELRASLSAPPGEVAAWLNSFDCSGGCNRPIVGVSLGTTYGSVQPDGRAYEIGAGLSGLSPYVEGFLQHSGGEPTGVGIRIGIPGTGWREDALFLAHDPSSFGSGRVVMTTTLLHHAATSPNGQSSGRLVALVHGVGLRVARGDRVLTPAILVGIGHASRRQYGDSESGLAGLLVISLGRSGGRPRPRPRRRGTGPRRRSSPWGPGLYDRPALAAIAAATYAASPSARSS